MTESASIDPSLLQRKIIHFDMDTFYASVETRDNPELAGKPVVIGGSPQSRGVVCTANYEARKFGIKSAMPCSQAYRLCPDAIFLPPNFSKYREASDGIRSVFKQFTDKIEPYSLDEAFLDVSQHEQDMTATKIAVAIQKKIHTDFQLTGSAGVAPNKMIAKICSDVRKPFGITVVPPSQVAAFMRQLSLRQIPGIGPATEKKLHKHGFSKCEDLYAYSVIELQSLFGDCMGRWLFQRCRGIDNRSVEGKRERKSISMERTFSTDKTCIDEISDIVEAMVEELVHKLREKRIWGRTWVLKIKYNDFKSINRSMTVDTAPFSPGEEISQSLIKLLEKTEVGQRPIRLAGVGCSNLTDHKTSKVIPFPSEPIFRLG